MAWLGPCIGPQHFEIGAEVREALLAADGAAEEAIRPNARGAFHGGFARPGAQPARARLGLRRIFGGGECTYERADRYFSHRRDGRTGRQATLIWLEPPPDR